MRYFKHLLPVLLISLILIAAFPVYASAAAGENHMTNDISVVGGYFTDGFDPSVQYYDVYMEKFTSEFSVSVILNNERFSYTVTGDDKITADNNADNMITVTVQDPMGEFEQEEYFLHIYIGLDSSSDIPWTGLTYLDVENGIFSPQFSRYRITYYAVLENSVNSFEAAGVNYRAINPDANIEVACRDTLNEDGTIPEGKRVEYTIKVTENSGKSKTYYLNLYRKAHITSSISDTAVLSNIKINGGSVPVNGFSAHKSYYEIKVPKTVSELDIQAYPADRSDIAEVLGPTTMNKDGAIFVNILVTSPSEDTYSIYTLRLEYDSFLFTEKYTAFQMLVYALIAVALGISIGATVSFYLMKSKKQGRKDGDQIENALTEIEYHETIDMH